MGAEHRQSDDPVHVGERVLVDDAGAPDLDVHIPTMVLDCVAMPIGPSPAEEAAATWAQAAEAAAHHLERVQRAARRHPNRARAGWMDLPLAELRFAVVDLETTGTHAGAEILEIGAVHVVDDRLESEFSTLVRPWGEIAPAAYTVHGIGAHAVLDAPRIEAVLPSWFEHAFEHVLVFHNAGFDLGFLQRALRDAERPLLVGPLVDTLTLARRLLGGRCGLGEAARRLAIPGPHLHRALPDARLTAKLLVALLDVLKDAGATRLGDVPGASTCVRRVRATPSARPGTVERRFEAALLRGESLRIACRLGSGIAPLELRIRPQLLQSGVCTALDLDRGVVIQLDLARIDACASDR